MVGYSSRMKRGFTIVEVLIVVIVISIIASIGVFGFNQYRYRSIDSQAKAIVNIVKSGAERYYDVNNEYPPAQTLFTSAGSTAPSCGTAPNYAHAASLLNTNSATLNASAIQLETYAGTDCTWSQSKVYYLTKTNTDGNTNRAYVITGCTYTLADPAPGSAGASALIAYYSRQDGFWKVYRTNRGTITTSNGTTCPFSSS